MITLGTRFPLEVRPRLPKELERLADLANDLVYSWDRAIRSLYLRLDKELWAQCGHSPKIFLRRVSQQRLDEAVADPSYMEDYRRVMNAYDAYLEQRGHPELTAIFNRDRDLIAYFCLEFGFHESFPIYSGGLGILAGDHCKAASDLGLPFVAVGLLYQAGYFTQTIDGQGHQQVAALPSHPHDLPVVPTLAPDGQQLTLDIEFPGRVLKVRVWTARAGHITLYLLDTNLPDNSEADRRITYQLYGGDREMRLQQELVLGVCGVRALRELGLRPTVWHINEGHAAFQLLERCVYRMGEGLDFLSAMELVAAGTVFTTHTPVPAGHDIFERHLVARYLTPLAHSLGLEFEQLYALGMNSVEGFNMTSLALRCTRFHNGVSRIHGGVASAMEQHIWPQVPAEENPIGYVTNGVHLETFLSRDWISLFDLRMEDWRNELLNEDYWERLEGIPDFHYWSIHKALKQSLLEAVAELLEKQHRRNGTSDAVIRHMTRNLRDQDADILVMGFARRFATYKRAGMLFADPARLAQLLGDPERPAIIIFAGKAHPHDEPGQALIKLIYDYSMSPEFIGKIILLEGYDLALARQLVSGVDVWLNTPEYPLEASGTSGQKAALNGAVNLSVLDGWWDEGYSGDNGWGITPRSRFIDAHQRYQEEANDLLNILEHEVFPTYFERDGSGYSPSWVAFSKASMKSILPRFNAQRMVRDYVHDYYAPARNQRDKLDANGSRLAQELAAWKQKVRDAWPQVRVELMLQPPAHIRFDEAIILRVRANLDGLAATDVRLECMLGCDDDEGNFVVEQTTLLSPMGMEDGYQLFGIDLAPKIPGLQYYKLRMYPYNPAQSHPFELGMMIWI